MLLIFTVQVYWTFPETKGLTLEEIASIFETDGDMEMLEGVEVPEKLPTVASTAVTAVDAAKA